MSTEPKTILDLLDAKAREYMRRIIRDMVEWRRREAELIANLVARNARRLRDRLSNYRLEPGVVWSPRAVARGGPVDLPELEPYRFEMVWPRPAGLEDMFVDRVQVYGSSVEERRVTHDSNIVYREYVLKPGTASVGTEELPKTPFFDNLALSPAELIRYVEEYLSQVYAEVVLDVEAEYTSCSVAEEGGVYRYLCRPVGVRPVNVPPGEYTFTIGATVDFQFTHSLDPTFMYKSFVYHGAYTGSAIIYWTQDSTQYIISIDFYYLDGAFKKYVHGGTEYDCYAPAHVVVTDVVDQNTPANVKSVKLHVPGAAVAARLEWTDQSNNWTHYVAAYNISFNTGLNVVVTGRAQ